jgi:hypothetical protein
MKRAFLKQELGIQGVGKGEWECGLPSLFIIERCDLANEEKSQYNEKIITGKERTLWLS